MSDFDDRMGDQRADDELERRLDAAFASTRPRRGFEDELWRRLEARRPWWRKVRLPAVPIGRALGGVAAVLLVGVLVVGVVRSGALRGPGGGGLSTASQSGAAPQSGAASQSLAFGLLPRPSTTSSLPPLSGASRELPSNAPEPGRGALPTVPPRLLVYRYTASAGPANGTVLDPASVPPGFEAAYYPSRQPAEAARDAAAPPVATQAGAPELSVTQARLVYLAVTSGSVGYLEPAYEITGTAKSADTTSPFMAIVPAIAATALR